MLQLPNPLCLEPVLRDRKSHCNEKLRAAAQQPHLPQLEKVLAQQRRFSAAKNKIITLKKKKVSGIKKEYQFHPLVPVHYWNVEYNISLEHY